MKNARPVRAFLFEYAKFFEVLKAASDDRHK